MIRVDKGYLLALARERSTWRGVVAILTAFGLVVSPEQSDAIIAGGLAVIGLIGTFMRDTAERP